jgi:5'-3' exonuclease
MLKDIFYHLSKSEDYFFKNVYSVYKTNKEVYRDTLNLNESYENIHFYTDDIVKFNKDGYKQRYYKYFNIYDSNKACEDYIQGLYWILGYYNNHSHDNWSWFYSFDATPFASDIFEYLRQYKEKIQHNVTKIIRSIPNDPISQLFMVLPKQSLLEILKEQNEELFYKTQRILNTYSETINDYYPSKIYLDIIHREYLWQAKIFLKQFDKNILDVFLEDITDTAH